MTPIVRSQAERAQAWLVTGPAGHLWSGALTLAVAWAGWAWGFVRRRASR